jgi:hypothetical protein
MMAGDGGFVDLNGPRAYNRRPEHTARKDDPT